MVRALLAPPAERGRVAGACPPTGSRNGGDSLSNVATHLDRRVAEHVRENVGIATSGMLSPHRLRHALEITSIDRIMLSGDYPFHRLDAAEISTTVLLIGASRGLGLAIAEEHLERGAQVVATVRGPEPTAVRELRRSFTDRFEIEAVDITAPDQGAGLLDRPTGRRFNRLSVNAGVTNAADAARPTACPRIGYGLRPSISRLSMPAAWSRCAGPPATLRIPARVAATTSGSASARRSPAAVPASRNTRTIATSSDRI